MRGQPLDCRQGHAAPAHVQPDVAQQAFQAGNGGLAAVVEEQDETLQLRPEVAGDAGRQRRHQGAPVRGQERGSNRGIG